MRRIRIVFALLAAALLAPTALLVARALESVRLERASRHEIVSARIFDEMERTLLALVEREEARPFEHYRFYYTPSGTVGGRPALARSPLADLRAEPFVVGHFQIDPDGSLHTPLVPRDAEAAERAGDFTPTPGVLAAARALRAVLGGGALDALASDPAGAFRAARQAPGSTHALRPPAPGKDRAGDADAEPADRKREVTLYDALTELNVGLEKREARQQKVEQRRDAPAPRAPAAPAEEALSMSRRVERPAEALGAEHAAAALEPERARSAAEGVRIAIDPFVGRPLGDGHFALVRDVQVDGRRYRQGLVLELPALWDHLRRAGLPGGELAEYARLAFVGAGLPGPPAEAGGDAYVYRHRFAEPFEALGARLELAPLPDPGGAPYVYALSLCLAAAATLGLLALYRMVSVAVHFAERRSNFAAAVSHELKTPLTAIRMYAEMLRDGMVPESKRRRYYTTITAESERLSRLINNVLEFSRLERGRREMHLVAGPIAPCVEEAVETLRPHAEREGFRVDVRIEPDLPPARFDRDALLQVLFNLLDNAFKYAADAREPVVTVSCRPEGERVVVCVRDRGPGIAARHLRRVFEPFYRGEDELVRTARGTGLGLALVKGLVERMGGAIAGRNARGGGFEVTVALPAATAPSAATA